MCRTLRTDASSLQKDKTIRQDVASSKLAEMVLSVALGSQQLARVTEDPELIRKLKAHALSLLDPS